MARRGKKSIKWDGILTENLTYGCPREEIDKRFNTLFDIYGIKEENREIALERLVFFLAHELGIQGFMYKSEYEEIAKEQKEYIYWKLVNLVKSEKLLSVKFDFLEEITFKDKKLIDSFLFSLGIFKENNEAINEKSSYKIIEEIIKEISYYEDKLAYYYRIQRSNKMIKNEKNRAFFYDLHSTCQMYETNKNIALKEKRLIESFKNRYC